MKQSYEIPSNSNNTFGLSLFLIHGCKRVSYVMHESVNIEIDDNGNIKMHITLIRISLNCIIVNIIPLSDSHYANDATKCKPG